MNYRYMGNTGLRVSEICLGTMTFGGDLVQNELATVNQHEANLLVDTAVEQGINFFDSADVYSAGISETVLGKAISRHRQDAVIATKVRFAMSSKPNEVGLSRRHIIQACENSLRRLGTDYIDLYQVHSYDEGTPLGETLEALTTLVRQGKVRYIGCSNLAAWQTMKALSVSEKLNLEKFVTSQLYYSIGARDIEHEIVPMCLDQKLGILCWSPLSGGFFTGKFRKNEKPEAGARRTNAKAPSMKYWPVNEEQGYEIVEALEAVSRNYDKTIAQTALNWLLQKPAVCSLVTGVKNREQLLQNIGASGWSLSPDDVQFLDNVSRISVPYPMWHQHYNDRR